MKKILLLAFFGLSLSALSQPITTTVPTQPRVVTKNVVLDTLWGSRYGSGVLSDSTVVPGGFLFGDGSYLFSATVVPDTTVLATKAYVNHLVDSVLTLADSSMVITGSNGRPTTTPELNFTTGRLIYGRIPTATANHAALSLGTLFNGISSGRFSGSANGTFFGINNDTTLNTSPDFVNFQSDGTSIFTIGRGLYNSGSQNHITSTATFAPTTGSVGYNHIWLTPTINHNGSGGATNVIYVNPTATRGVGDFRGINVDYTCVIDNAGTSHNGIRVAPRLSTTVGISATQWAVKDYLIIQGRANSWFANVFGNQSYVENLSTDASGFTKMTGCWAGSELSSNGSDIDISTGLFASVTNSGNGIIRTAYGARIELRSNTGTINNTYGLYIDDVTSGTQTNQAYGLYQVDPSARNYFASFTGFGTATPSATVDIQGNMRLANLTASTNGTDSIVVHDPSTGFFKAISRNRFALKNDTNTFGALTTGSVTSSGLITATQYLATATNNGYILGSLGRFKATANGVHQLTNNTENGFDRLCFGGSTSGFPSISRQNTAIRLLLADTSGYAQLQSGQFSVNGAPQASAAVTITSTTQGFLPSRMTGTQAEAISAPAEGLMVYSTDGSGATITSKGWWGWDGSAWVKLNP